MANKSKYHSSKNDLISYVLSQDTIEKGEKADVSPYVTELDSQTCYDADIDSDLAVIFIGRVKALKCYLFKFTDYPFYRIVYTSSGRATLKYDKKSYELSSGSIYGLAPEDPAYIENSQDTPWVHYFLHFTGKEAFDLFKKSGLLKETVYSLSSPVQIHQMFENILDETKQTSELSPLINSYYLRILLLKLADKSMHSKEHLSVSQNTYLQCRNYIKNNFSEIISIRDISDNCFINKGYLCRLFRQYSNETPLEYVRKLKMNKAALLLKQTDISIKRIAYTLNFENQYYFSKVFKKTFGISPKFYREKIS